MAKVIKRSETTETQIEPQQELTQIVEARRAPIIDRETFEARANAQGIRDRAQLQADEISQKAQADAEALLEQARQSAEQLKQEAQAQGHAEGREQGVAELLEVVSRTGLALQEAQAQLIPQVGELALRIARKIIGRELAEHPESVVEIVKQALGDKARQRKEILLRVHPQDAAMIREHKAALLEMLSRTKELAIIEDANVQRHGVIIETDAGSIDAQLDTQLAVFERVMQEIG